MGVTAFPRRPPRVVIVGAGIGGLATALRLADAGCAVTVVESQATPGGKMRCTPSPAGPVDAGPTVLTLKPVFDALFADVGERLDDHVTLRPLDVLARHYWPDGATLDLMADPDHSAANVAAAFGARAAQDYRAFAARARRLFDAFDAPMMQAAAPSQARLALQVLRRPQLLADMAPHRSLARMLDHAFAEPRLRQLFGRYATYVGGSPFQSPALLALVSDAEARGVWSVAGGMHRLAQVIADRAAARGAVFHYNAPVTRISLRDGRASGVEAAGRMIAADAVVFNGDPQALVAGLAGQALRAAVPDSATQPRSLSAHVVTGAARFSGPPLSCHTVFFGSDPAAEFATLARGQRPRDATLYICAQDHGSPAPTMPPDAPERFEIILNGAPTAATTPKDVDACLTDIIARLSTFGLTLRPAGPLTLTTPQDFARLFPGSQGSLYGRSPHGLTAGLARPQARTRVPGLYLAGGGAHPGAGVPMATLSARHAAVAILADLALPSRSRPAAMPGGMSTG